MVSTGTSDSKRTGERLSRRGYRPHPGSVQFQKSFLDFIVFSRCRHLRAGKKPAARRQELTPIPSPSLGVIADPGERTSSGKEGKQFALLLLPFHLSDPYRLLCFASYHNPPCRPLNPTTPRQKPSLRHIRRRRFSPIKIKMRNKQCKSLCPVPTRPFACCAV